MNAAIVHLTIEQGATFRQPVQFLAADDTPVDFTGCTARMQIRRTLEDLAVLLELTTENGRLAIDVPTGTLTMNLTAIETAALDSGGVYDLEVLFADGSTSRMLKGMVLLDREVTR